MAEMTLLLTIIVSLRSSNKQKHVCDDIFFYTHA
jgi:hypothetical protein